MGALGAIVIHTTPSAGYPWQVVRASNGTERFQLATSADTRAAVEMWATEDASRKLASSSGHDLDEMRRAAESRDFRPIALGVHTKFSFHNTLRSVESANVLGKLTGTDPTLRAQAVIYTAHHDHLGIREPKGGDAIYNGAIDNASGVAGMLAIARAASLAPRPKRTLVFAAVAAEEQGLLGSAWYCAHPTFGSAQIAADINLDGLNLLGKTTDVSFVGWGKSSLDAVVEAVAKTQGRTVHDEAFIDRGSFYRSDQFNFAKIGVPAIYLRGGPHYIDRSPSWGEEQEIAYERTRYHQPQDEVDPSWDYRGAVQDLQLLLLSGLRIANTEQLPQWKAGDEFEKIRRSASAADSGGPPK
ncbi:MAG: hypothetical protein NVS3B20_13810 [Polyangiales bacterium]